MSDISTEANELNKIESGKSSELDEIDKELEQINKKLAEMNSSGNAYIIDSTLDTTIMSKEQPVKVINADYVGTAGVLQQNNIPPVIQAVAQSEPTTAEIVESMKPKNEPFKARKIAIIGFAETSYKLAPAWTDPTWEIWGLNGLHKVIQWNDRITRWFQIHPKESVFGEGLGGGADHVKFLKSLKIPVYMTQHYDEIPSSIAYPLKEICEWVSIGREKERHPYFSNTISEIIALLQYEIIMGAREVDEVGVWGVDMAHSCLIPETKVLTADLRWIRADEAKVGQKLIGFDEDAKYKISKNQLYRKWTITEIEEITRLKRPCYRLTFTDGTQIISSAEHKWLCNFIVNYWQTTEKIIPIEGCINQDISINIPKEEFILYNMATAVCKPYKYNVKTSGIIRDYNPVKVAKKEFIGEQEVIGWKTSTNTFIAEGFASHNSEYSYQKSSCEFYLGIFEGWRQLTAIFDKLNMFACIDDNGAYRKVTLPFPKKWWLPKESTLLQGKYIYGYEEAEDEAEYKRLQARRQILINNRNNYLVKEQENHDAQMQFLGAMQELDNEIKNRGY